MVSIVNSLTGSSLDIQALAKGLTEAARAPQQALLDSRKTVADAKISSIGRIYSAANDFKLSLEPFGDAKALPFTPETSNDAVASFSFRSYYNPSAIDLTFQVKQLATPNAVTLAPLPKDASLTGGGAGRKLTLYDGAPSADPEAARTELAAIDLSADMSLEELRETIRKVSGFDATIMNATSSTGADRYLKITRGTGLENNFFIEISDSASTQPLTDGLRTGAVTSSAGQNAEIISDGVTYTSASNRFSTLVSGVNIDVKTATGDETVHLSTSSNTGTLTDALRALVKGYNALLASVTDEIQYDVDVKKRGGLSNDPIARDLLSQMQRMTTAPIIGALDRPVTLAEVGVRTNRDGSLTIDEAVLKRTLESRPEILEAVVASGPNAEGALERMRGLADKVVAPKSSFVTLYDKTSKDVMTKIDEEIAELNDQMTALEQRYLRQFTAMQNVITSTDSTKGTLTSFMESWTASLKSS